MTDQELTPISVPPMGKEPHFGTQTVMRTFPALNV